MTTEPLDDWLGGLDEAIPSALRGLHPRVDPPPPGTAEQILLSLTVSGPDTELASPRQERLVGTGARAPERARAIGFDAASITVMITVVETADERVRLDGWLAPAAALRWS